MSAISSNEIWASQLRERLVREHVPVSGSIALTERCNLRCAHCYLDHGRNHDRQGSELSTGQVLQLVDQVTDAGCLTLLLTGGEPLLRPDFAQIYRHARERGLLVTVFSNATLVTASIAELLGRYPPFMVEVSLYGASAATAERVTGVPDSFQRCLRGVQRLLDHGVRVGLKTVVMTLNQHEVPAMRRLAEELGVRFRIDAAIFPGLDGSDRSPLQLRVSPETAVQHELADPRRLQEWIDTIGALPEERRPDPRLYRCGAGVTSFHIDPYGFLSPCLMATRYRQPLLGHDFATLWRTQLEQLQQRSPRPEYRCNTCEMADACSACPAFHLHETGAEDVESEYVCATTRQRWAAIQSARDATDQHLGELGAS